MSSDKLQTNEVESDRTNTEEETVDSALDVTSEFFDPLKALYSKSIHIPVKNAKLYDNVSKFESALLKKAIVKKGGDPDASSVHKPSTSKAFRPNAENPFERRFLPHQSWLR